MEREGYYLKTNSEYTEVLFLLSNGQNAKIGFCKKHAANLTEKDYPAIMAGIRHGWEKEFKINRWSEKQIEEYKKNFFNLTITKRLKDEEITAGN